jgi:hypothetical protein
METWNLVVVSEHELLLSSNALFPLLQCLKDKTVPVEGVIFLTIRKGLSYEYYKDEETEEHVFKWLE